MGGKLPGRPGWVFACCMPGGAAVPGAAIPGGGARASQPKLKMKSSWERSELTHAWRRTICTIVRSLSIETRSYVIVKLVSSKNQGFLKGQGEGSAHLGKDCTWWKSYHSLESEVDQGSIQTFGTDISCQQKSTGGEICGELSRTPNVARARLAVTGTCKCFSIYSVLRASHISSGGSGLPLRPMSQPWNCLQST